MLSIRSGAVLLGLLLVACGREPTRSAADQALYDQGRMAYNRLCAGCHEVRTRVNRIGPYLVAVEDRRAGTVRGFKYSAAMRDFGLKWDADTLDAFLADPRTTIPGTDMAIDPVEDPEERAAIIYYVTQR